MTSDDGSTTPCRSHCRARLHCLILVLVLSYVSPWSPSSLFRRRQQRIITFPDQQDEANIHEYFMKLALEEASEAGRLGEVPIGAILVQRQESSKTNPSASNMETTSSTSYRILARAGNRVEGHYDASAHAELQVLRKGAKRSKNWRLPNSTLYSTLEPCPMCLAACQAFRLPTLVYGAPDLRLGAVETHIRLLDTKHPFHNVTTVVKDVCKEESAGMLRSFFKRRRKGQGKQRSWRLRLPGRVSTE